MFVTIVCRVNQWPFLESKQILANKSENAHLQISTGKHGYFIVKYDADHTKTELVTQQVVIPDDGYFILSAGMRFGKLELVINDITLLTYEESAGACYEVKTSRNQIVASINYLEGVKYPELGKTESDRFFLRTLQEVHKLVASQDPYERLKLSGLLRQLLLDKPCLIDIVNETHKLALEYRPVDARITPMPSSNNQIRALSIYHPGSDIKDRPSRSRGSFIQVPVAYRAGDAITVQDVILANANKQGGVHYDLAEPNKPSQQNSLKLDKEIEVGGLKLSALLLKNIALVMLDAVEPLVSAITTPAP